MPRKPADPRTRMAEWRARQLDRHDPVGFAVLEALQARALQYDGITRQQLEQRLGERVADYARRLPRACADTGDAGASAAPTPLAALVAELAARPQQAPQAVEPFRALWATVRSRSQVRQSLAAAPSDGGPLNSAVLVHRAITLMGQSSPGYLKHFLGYLDNLSWLEHLQPRSSAPARDVGRIAKPRRSRAAKG